MTTGQFKKKGIAQAIHDGMDFGGFASSTDTDMLVIFVI
jgi:hypothetical protein